MNQEIEKARAIEYSKPIRWIDFKAVHGALPYQSPTQEYIQHNAAPTENQLMYRWQEMGVDLEIFRIYSSPKSMIERHKFHMKLRRDLEIPIMDGPEDLRIDNAMDVIGLTHDIAKVQEELDSGITIVRERFQDKQGIWCTQEVPRVLSVREKETLYMVKVKLIHEKQLLLGKATEIVDIGRGGGLAELISQGVADINKARVIEIVPQAIEGETVEDAE